MRKSKGLLIVVLLLIVLNIFNIDIYGLSDIELNSRISSDMKDGYGFFYKDSSTGQIAFYRVNQKKIVGKESLETIMNTIKSGKHELFVNAQGTEQNPFPNTSIADDRFTSGKLLSNLNIYGNYKTIRDETRDDSASELSIAVEGNIIQIYLPAVNFKFEEPYERPDGSIDYRVIYVPKNYAGNDKYGLTESVVDKYITEYEVNHYTENAIEEIAKAVQEGIVAGSIETGFNVGSVYSKDKQLPLVTIMDEVVENGERFFKFKDTVSMTAGLDYFFNPIFGRMYVAEGIPKTAEEWNTKSREIDITKGYIDIDSSYKGFVSPNSEEREGIFEVGTNLTFTNGVEAYVDFVSTKTPKKLVNYNLTIALPHKFTSVAGGGVSSYQLEEGSLTVLNELRMSVYNDTIYNYSGEKKEKVCTNDDIDLQRDYIVLYHYMVDGEPVGAVIVLKYSEVVVDTRDISVGGAITQDGIEGSDDEPNTGGLGDKLYLTGRTVTLNNAYSSRLNLDEENRDIMANTTKIQGIVGVKPRMYAFPYEGTPTSDYIVKVDNHRTLEASEGMSFLINFQGSSIGSGDTQSLIGFYIVVNNMYVQDPSLLNWLSTSDAISLPNVKAEELADLIRGVFKSNDLTFFDWLRIREIESELTSYKNSFLYRVINVFLIVVGTLMFVFGILFIFTYWFDVFNNFTDFSILSFISFGSMYPVIDKEAMVGLSPDRKYVTFKDVVIRVAIIWVLGYIFLENRIIIETVVSIYMYVMRTMGGR